MSSWNTATTSTCRSTERSRFAGIWERWRGAEGEVVDSCTMLTTEANEEVSSVGQTRMPVVLTGEPAYAKWLNSAYLAESRLNRCSGRSRHATWNSIGLKFY